MAEIKNDTEFASLVSAWEATESLVPVSAADEDDDSALYLYDDEDYAREVVWDYEDDFDEFGPLHRRWAMTL